MREATQRTVRKRKMFGGAGIGGWGWEDLACTRKRGNLREGRPGPAAEAAEAAGLQAGLGG